MNFHEFPINQSLIRGLLYNSEDRDERYCLRSVYLTRITRQLKMPVSNAMLAGKYFETKCLGKSSGYDVHDLPRKKLTKKQLAENAVRKKENRPLLLGDKYLDHIRIDDQVNRFNALCQKYQIVITDSNVQVKLRTIWENNPDVMLSAELDVFPTTILIDGELEAAIIDLKLTADIHNGYGEYCYGKPEYLDLIQGKMYHYIVRNINTKLNPELNSLMTDSVKTLIAQNRILFLLWIFNYKGDVLEDKFIKVTWDKTKEHELHASISKTISIMEDGEKTGWPANPVDHLCKRCPWTECPDRIKI